ncbi:MAG TPA: amidohydrolase family protein [Pyrinomonadaceae bacterium]|nr:amidohydrolase family protein [Pyrinomonadaceae bacterium]
MKILSANYVLPISAEPIENGAIAFEKDKIIAVGKCSEIIEKFPEALHENLGCSAILPGFVNAHSHLEITAMRGFLDEFDADFFAWLMKLTKTRSEVLTDEDVKNAAVFGALEGARAGVTCFGDIGRFGKAGFEALKINGLRGILFQETEFSPVNENAPEDFARLKEKFLELKSTETELVKIGLSPHSPYTVSRSLFENIAEYALSENIKFTIHAAESSEEEDFMKKGVGLFAELYKKGGFEWNTPRVSSIEYLEKIGVLQTKPLLAHCVKVSEKDIELIAESDTCIAHCPKSNAKFGHGIAPLEKFLDAKIKTAFGSDSMASNNTCDILEEARFATLFARNLPDTKRFLQAEEIIKTATFGGAKSLGFENEIGSLETGKQADFIAVSLENAAQMPVHDIFSALLFASNARDVFLTIVAGKEIYRNGEAKLVDEKELKMKISEIAIKML